MLNFQHDQAAGLRQLMSGHQPKMVAVLSANSVERQASLMRDLAATLSAQQTDVLLVHAAQDTRPLLRQYGLESSVSLHDVAKQTSTLAQSVHSTDAGYFVTKLLPKPTKTSSTTPEDWYKVSSVFKNLSSLYEVVLMDVALDKALKLPLDTLATSQILIQLGRDAESIKEAYVIIKQLYSQLGRRPFGLIIDGATDAQAATVFRNIAQVARDYMQIDLEFFGAIPNDDHLQRAAKLGRSLSSAFPNSKAGKAYQALAQRIHYKQAATESIEMASFI